MTLEILNIVTIKKLKLTGLKNGWRYRSLNISQDLPGFKNLEGLNEPVNGADIK